jgi:PPOX class probable F420-dependent enzyme
MKEMTRQEIDEFLMQGTRTGKVATVREDGRPHVVPIWFVMDGDDILFTTWHTTVKLANMRRDSRVALCVDDQTPPYAYAMVEGTVTLSDDPAELRHWATRIGGRYMGQEQAEAFGRRNAVPGEWLVRLHIEQAVGHSDMAA